MGPKPSPQGGRGASPQQGARPSPSGQNKYPLPTDTQALAGIYAKNCLNYGLRLEKFLLWPRKTGGLPENAKKDIQTFRQSGELVAILDACKARWEALLNSYQQRGYTVKRSAMSAASRVIVGLGAESVLETSIRLHRIYGFPIIPASALKGLARSYARLIEGKDPDDEAFMAVFGKPPHNGWAGKVIFFDAVPANSNIELELDVMNPHYAPYYQGSAPPADYHNPVPIFFLTIARGSEFLFAVASKEEPLAQQAWEWLCKGLEEMGIGAKTTSGYGLWQVASEIGELTEEPKTTSGHGLWQGPQGTTDKEPPFSTEPPRTGLKVWAEVVDNSQKPIKVRLLLKGYEDASLECMGVRNLSSFPPGTYILVEITQMRGGQIQQVSLREIRWP